jgi:hypothetical protein
MRRFKLRLCLGTSFIGAVLVLGCVHSRHCSCEQAKADSIAPAMASHLRPVLVVSSYTPIPQPSVVETKIVEAPAAPETVEDKAIEQTSQINVIPEPPETVHRRTYADISADPCFSHAPDYTSVTGELHHYTRSDVWTLRYTSVDEDDKYGGSVTLTDMGSMDGYESGQMAHVEGRLVDPDSKEPSPKYQVQSIRPVKK